MISYSTESPKKKKISYSTVLFLENDKEALVAGVNTMLQIAVKLLGKKTAKDGQHLLKDDNGDSEED